MFLPVLSIALAISINKLSRDFLRNHTQAGAVEVNVLPAGQLGLAAGAYPSTRLRRELSRTLRTAPPAGCVTRLLMIARPLLGSVMRNLWLLTLSPNPWFVAAATD
jgi:hypothetical protein